MVLEESQSSKVVTSVYNFEAPYYKTWLNFNPGMDKQSYAQ